MRSLQCPRDEEIRLGRGRIESAPALTTVHSSQSLRPSRVYLSWVLQAGKQPFRLYQLGREATYRASPTGRSARQWTTPAERHTDPRRARHASSRTLPAEVDTGMHWLRPSSGQCLGPRAGHTVASAAEISGDDSRRKSGGMSRWNRSDIEFTKISRGSFQLAGWASRSGQTLKAKGSRRLAAVFTTGMRRV